MKTLFASALFLITSVGAFSQDTLFTRNGEMIPAKVYEITQTDIKYRKPSNPDGPLYTISKDEIAVIEYKNRTKEVFPYQGQGQATQQTSQTTDNTANTQGSAPQVNNNYYGNPNPRPNVNVVLGGGGWGGFGMPYYGGYGLGWGGFGGWGWGRPYYRNYYGGGWGGYHHGGWGGYHHGGGWGHYGGHGHHR